MASRRKRVTVLAFSPLRGDARVLRQLHYLAERFDVTAIGFGDTDLPIDGVEMVSVPQPKASVTRAVRTGAALAVGRFAPAIGYRAWYLDRREYRAAERALAAIRPDAIVANDWSALPVCARAREGSHVPIVVDLHEYAPRHFENRGYWKLLIGPMIDHHLQRHLRDAAHVVTVNESLARMYERTYGIECGVVRNIPRTSASPGFRATNPDRIRLVHHGIGVPDRKLEIMIDAAGLLDTRYSLHFMLVAKNRGYLEQLRARAQRVAPGRIHFREPVKPHEIVETIAEYDVGLFILPPVNFNYEHALPNKYFEFIHAGLAVCTGPSVEMASLTRQHDCGVVAEEHTAEATASVLNALTSEQIDEYKRRSIAARRGLTAEAEVGKLVRLVENACASNE